MMISGRNTVLMFAVTMMSVFGMSYCCTDGLDCFELVYINENESQYAERTKHLPHGLKILREDFQAIQSFYRRFIGEIKDLAIVKLVYALLPEYDDFEADYLQRITLLGNHCNYGIQNAILNHYENRILYLAKKAENLLSEDNNDGPTLEVVQELIFLAERISQTTSKGRLQAIFMNAFYGNRLPMMTDDIDPHENTGYSHGGDFAYAPDEEEVKKAIIMHDENKKIVVQKERHCPHQHFLDKIHRLFVDKADKSRISKAPKHGRFITEPQAYAAGEETETATLQRHYDIHATYNSSACSESQKNHSHKCWLHNLLRKLKSDITHEHYCVADGEDHTDCIRRMSEDVRVDISAKIDLKVQISKHSIWLADLKHTNPMFGESYLSYALRALKRKKIPLSKYFLQKYHGLHFKLQDEFHIWPEKDSVFILFFLFNCPVGDQEHRRRSFGNDVQECDDGCKSEHQHLKAHESLDVHEHVEEDVDLDGKRHICHGDCQH